MTLSGIFLTIPLGLFLMTPLGILVITPLGLLSTPLGTFNTVECPPVPLFVLFVTAARTVVPTRSNAPIDTRNIFTALF
jgi:hypothetical protein